MSPLHKYNVIIYFPNCYFPQAQSILMTQNEHFCNSKTISSAITQKDGESIHIGIIN